REAPVRLDGEEGAAGHDQQTPVGQPPQTPRRHLVDRGPRRAGLVDDQHASSPVGEPQLEVAEPEPAVPPAGAFGEDQAVDHQTGIRLSHRKLLRLLSIPRRSRSSTTVSAKRDGPYRDSISRSGSLSRRYVPSLLLIPSAHGHREDSTAGVPTPGKLPACDPRRRTHPVSRGGGPEALG